MLDRPAQDSDDLGCLRAVARGDREAFAALVSRHAPSVRRLASALTGNDAEADDVTQEVFVSAWRSAQTFRARGSVRGWLLTITRNAVRRAARRRAGEPARTEPLEALAICAGWGTPGVSTEFERALESRELLARALSTLSDDDREVLTVVELEGLSLRESAALLELELPALKSRLHRARLRLLAAIKEMPDGR